jgi:lipid II:glycine glycyltransferase (peptidoglycan interpeptide bridge formation enzyme)
LLEFAAVHPEHDVALDDPPTSGVPVSLTISADPGASARREWDRLVATVPASDVTQLSGWTAIRNEAGYAPLYLLARQADTLVGGALVLLRRVPVVGQVGYIAYGPLVGPEAPRSATVTALVEGMEELARTRLAALFVQPTDGHDDVSSALLARGFRDSTAGVAPAATIRVDLSLPEDELRAGLSKRIRRWTGKWERSGVRVRRGDAGDLPLLVDLIGRSAEHQGFTELSADYVRTMYRTLAEHGHVELFVGEVDSEPVAAELFTTCGGVLRCRLTGLDRTSPATKLSVTSAVDWEAMRWAKSEGFREFDLGGLSADAVQVVLEDGFSSDRLDGPDRFKAGFGGRLHRYPKAVELISSPMVRAGYDALGSGQVGRAMVDRARVWMRQGHRSSRPGR